MKKYLAFISLLLVMTVSAVAQGRMPLGLYGQIPFRSGNTAADTATLVTAQMSALLTGTPTAAANYTTPTATQLCTLFPFVKAGANTGFYWTWIVKNTSAGANTITVVAGTGVTIVGTATIAQNALKPFIIVLDQCGPTVTPAAHIFSLGSATF